MIKTKNIKLCAYLRMEGIHPSEVIKLAKGKAEYAYILTREEFDRFQIAFNQSKYLDYANHMEAIKDLAY